MRQNMQELSIFGQLIDVDSVLIKHLLKQSSLNHRQMALISHAIRHPGYEYAINGHQRSLRNRTLGFT